MVRKQLWWWLLLAAFVLAFLNLVFNGWQFVLPSGLLFFASNALSMALSIAAVVLKKLGYEAEAVPDGASALRADAEACAAGHPFSVIIMDLTIPGGMGGDEAVVASCAQRTTARLIASSGYANDPVMAQYRSYQFDAVLAKPYSFVELTSVLASLADQLSISAPVSDVASCRMPSWQTAKPTSSTPSSRNHMTWKGLQRLSPGSAPLE
jgi:CheY-like chemotaxis protein